MNVTIRSEFFDTVCEAKQLWVPLFYVNAILLVLGLVGLVSATPGSGSKVIAVASLIVLVPPFVCMLAFFRICKNRPG